MTRRIIEHSFNPEKEAICRKTFTASGCSFIPGDPFPWRKMGIPERKARLLFDAGHIRHPENGEAVEPIDNTMPDVAVEVSKEYESVIPTEEELEGMKIQQLREVARTEGAIVRRSREEIIQSILENRKQ